MFLKIIYTICFMLVENGMKPMGRWKYNEVFRIVMNLCTLAGWFDTAERMNEQARMVTYPLFRSLALQVDPVNNSVRKNVKCFVTFSNLDAYPLDLFIQSV